MGSFKIIIVILVIFLKTGNVLSLENIFNVNNIEITKKINNSNEDLANKAIKKGFGKLLEKILLKEDIENLSGLEFFKVKELVSYYQITDEAQNNFKNKVNFNIFFDKDKLHTLFSSRNISYSDISDKELYLLPVIQKKNQIYIYNNNYYYNNWNKIYQSELIEFILPIENIEVIQNITANKENLYGIDLKNLFKEYENKNLALVLIQNTNSDEDKIFLRTKVLNKKIDKTIDVKKNLKNSENFNKEVIKLISEELINIIKSQNLIDIRTPSFLNAKLKINNKNNLVELKNRLRNIDTVDGIFVQEFNNKYVLLKLRYLGKLNKIISQLKNQNIVLQLIGDQWNLRIKK